MEENGGDREAVHLEGIEGLQREASRPMPQPAHFEPDRETSRSVNPADPMDFAYNQDVGVSVGNWQHQPQEPLAAGDAEDPGMAMFFPDSDEEAMDTTESMQFSLIAAG